MTPRRLAIAAVAAATLVVLAWLLEVQLPEWKAERERKERTLWSGRGEMSPFIIERDGATWRFDHPPGAGWTVDSGDVHVSADPQAIVAVSKALSGFGGIDTVIAATPTEEDLAARGLAAPRLVLRWTDDWQRSRSLAVGDVLPGDQRISALLDDGRLVAVPREIKDVLDRPFGSYRTKALTDFEWPDVERVAIDRGPDLPAGASARIVLERRHDPAAPPDSWRIVEPIEREANGLRVMSIVSKLAGLQAADFGAETPSSSELAMAGLEPPAAIVAATLADGSTIVLRLGGDAGEKLAWGRLDDGPLVQVRADLRADARLEDDLYRDARPMRLPRWKLVNLRIRKGTDRVLDLEVQKAGKGWDVVKPAPAELPPEDADALLGMLDQVRCGRFEDELAGRSGAAEDRWDFGAKGGLRLEGSAMLDDGRPLRVTLDATPFKHSGDLYYAVRTVDQDLHEEVCVAKITAFDALLAKARVVARRAAGEDGSPAPSHE